MSISTSLSQSHKLFSFTENAARLLVLALASTTALSITACGGGGGGSSGAVLRTPPQKPQYDVTEGENAKMETISQVSPIQTYFSKRYNRPNLEGVLRASGAETVKYIRALTVNPYRVFVSDDDPYFSMLEKAPEDMKKVWAQASGGVSGGSLAGLYFDACGFIKCTMTNFQPTILVANTSTRWVIVHEMMHHLFNVQRRADHTMNSGMASQKMEDSANKIQYFLDQFKEQNDRYYLMQAANEFTNLVPLVKLALASSKLEETTVERVLVDEWNADRLVYVDLEMATNAVWYMTSNAKAALDADAQITNVMNQVVATADAANAQDAKNVMLQNIANLGAFDQDIKQTVIDASNIVKAKIAALKAKMGTKTLINQLSHPFTAKLPIVKSSCMEDHHEFEAALAKISEISAH